MSDEYNKQQEKLKEREKRKTNIKPERKRIVEGKRSFHYPGEPYFIIDDSTGKMFYFNTKGYSINWEEYNCLLNDFRHEEIERWEKVHGKLLDDYDFDDIDQVAQDEINDYNNSKDVEFLNSLTVEESKELIIETQFKNLYNPNTFYEGAPPINGRYPNGDGKFIEFDETGKIKPTTFSANYFD